MFHKDHVAGSDKQAVYHWLSDQDKNGWNDKEASWNFTKYLVDKKGNLKNIFFISYATRTRNHGSDKMNTNDIIGGTGVGLTLIAYFCNIFSFIPKDGKLFFLLNIFGGGLACYASFLINYWPFVVLEGTWVIISICGLIRVNKQL